MKLSKELAILRNAILYNLDKKPRAISSSINEQRLQKLVLYHKLRPILCNYLSFEQYPENDFLKSLKAYTHQQAFTGLKLRAESDRLIALLAQSQVNAVLMKGNSFLKWIFDNKNLREGSDIDLLVMPEQLTETLKILENDGYQINLGYGNLHHLANRYELITKSSHNYELPLRKGHLNIDLHWGIAYGFLNAQIPPSYIFSHFITKDKPNELSLEGICWILLNHNGAKELWLNLKNLADFLFFLNKYQNIVNWEEIFQTAATYKYQTSLKNGLYYIKNLFDFSLNPTLENYLGTHKPKNINLTIKYWEKAKHWGFFPVYRWYYERIYVQSQDEGFSTSQYLKKIYLAYSQPNVIEEPRLFQFPEKYPFLNFVSKFVSYLISKTLRLK